MYVLYRNVSHRAKSSGRKAEHRQKSASERDTNSIRLTLIYVYRGMGSPYLCIIGRTEVYYLISMGFCNYLIF